MGIMKNVKIGWAKVLGEPRPKYNPKEGNEWAVDLLFTPEQLKELKKEGYTVDAFLKEYKDGSGKYIKYTRDAVDKNTGKAKNPITIKAEDGTDWPADKLLGNGTVVDLKYSLTDPYRVGKETRVKLVVLAMKVVKHVPYEGGKDDFEYTPKTETTKTEEDW